VTHESMGQMLGTTRATISLSAEALKRAGLITYGRGRVQIVNPGGLQSVACDCYEVLSKLLASYRTELLRRNHGEENSSMPYSSLFPCA
jgi:Crp-like helix-turn-helix domain